MKRNIYNSSFLLARSLIGANFDMTSPKMATLDDGRSIVIERCKHLDQAIPGVIGQAFSFAEYAEDGRVIADFTAILSSASSPYDGVAHAIALHKDVPPVYREAYPVVNESIEERRKLNEDLNACLKRMVSMVQKYELELTDAQEKEVRDSTWERIMGM